MTIKGKLYLPRPDLTAHQQNLWQGAVDYLHASTASSTGKGDVLADAMALWIIQKYCVQSKI